MIEYPSIENSSKAPRRPMIAFSKIDGSNIRCKWTKKRSFSLYGSRTQLLDSTHPFLGHSVSLFSKIAPAFDEMFRKEKIFRDIAEVIVFGEYFGLNSFAGVHVDSFEDMKFLPFDILLIKKSDRRFLKPQDFIEYMEKYKLSYPDVIYEGNLNNEFINNVRKNNLPVKLNEGVVCKGTEYVGNFVGHIWMCKVKTQDYFDKLKQKFSQDEINNYWE